mmetsp:Transcript_4014/g.11916  ORF Transcript_4014/g.11916 Transcript_4014/m.11916 type:complete len:201 (+) Transcript_4014:636-1238(+)
MRALPSEHLLPRVGDDVELVPRRHVHPEDRRGCVADRQPLALVRDPVEAGHLGAASGAVEGEDDVVRRVRLREVWERAERGRDLAHVAQPELVDRIVVPRLAKRLPEADVHWPWAEHAPHDHLDRARVRGGDDADEVIVRQAEDRLGLLTAGEQLGLSDGRAVAAAERRIPYGALEAPARPLGTRAGAEIGAGRALSRHG